MNQFLALIAITAMSISSGSCEVRLEEFFPFGDAAGDNRLPNLNDVASPEIPLPLPINFFNTPHTSLWVSSIGIISFSRPMPDDLIPSCRPQSVRNKMISPFWADSQTIPGMGDVTYRQTTTDIQLFEKAEGEIVAAFPQLKDMNLAWALVATWHDLGRCLDDPTLRNTFQAVVASDTQHTFVIFYYNKIEWTDPNHFADAHARVGFDAGDGDPEHIFMIEGSCSSEISNVTHGSNYNQPGKYVFRIDDTSVIEPGCSNDWPSNQTILTFPSHVSVYGHQTIHFQGPCFDKATHVTCTFKDLAKGDISVEGAVLDETTVACLAPFLYQFGRISVTIRVQESNQNVTEYTSSIFVTNNHRNILEMELDTVAEEEEPTMKFHWNSDDFPDQATLTLQIHFLGKDKEIFLQPLEIAEVDNNGTFTMDRTMLVDAVDGKWDHFFTFSVGTKENLTTRKKRGKKILAQMSRVVAPAGKAMATWAIIKATDYLTTCSIEDAPPNDLEPCPPTLQQALLDPIFTRDDRFIDFYHPGADTCYRSVNPSPSGGGQQCCYKYTNPGSPSEGNIMCGPPGGGTADKYSPHTHPFNHFFHDVVPWASCCLVHGGSSSQCRQYYKNRPSQCGDGYVGPTITQGNGDPHFTTFDNFNFTFNGHGEYWLMRNKECSAQVRMIPFTNIRLRHSELTENKLVKQETPEATVMSAVVFSCNQETSIQIQISKDGTSLEILADGQLFSFDDGLTSLTLGGFTFWEENNGIYLSFNGMTFTCHLQEGALMIRGVGCKDSQGPYSGLLGNCDGNPSNDLGKQDGTFLPPTSNLSSIHFDFGEGLRINEEESLFTYRRGEFYETFYHPEFVPSFEEPDPAGFSQEVQDVCGTHKACYFDFSVTKSVEFAQQTAKNQKELEESVSALQQEIAMCDALPNFDHGYYNLTDGFFVGSKAEPGCEDGFKLKGDEKLVCEETKFWSGNFPECNSGASFVTFNLALVTLWAFHHLLNTGNLGMF